MEISIDKTNFKLTQFILSKEKFEMWQLVEEKYLCKLEFEEKNIKKRVNELVECGLLTDYGRYFARSSL